MAYKLSRSSTSSPTRNTTATNGRRTATKARFNRRKYVELLAEAVPRVIETPEELERATRLVSPLLDKGEKRRGEEEALCRLLLKLIDDYQQTHPLIPELTPHEALQHLMGENNLRQADLVTVFGSRSRVSDAVHGKRAISKEQAKRLGEFFCVSPVLFI